MNISIENKRAKITILSVKFAKNNNIKNTLFMIAEHRRELAAARKNNDEDTAEYHRIEIQKRRKMIRAMRDKRYTFNIYIKKYKYETNLERVYAYEDHCLDTWKKFINDVEQDAIRQARKEIKIISHNLHRLGLIVTHRIGTKKRGFVYAAEGSVLKAYIQKNVQNLYAGKSPTTHKKYIGIELEFCAPINEEQFAIKLFQKGIHKYAQLKTDGSLRPKEKETGFELAILLEETSYKKNLKIITDVLQEIKAVSKDRRCGLHVHIDMRRRDKDLVYNNLVACQYALLSIVNPERYNNEFCRVVEDRIFPTEFTGERQERYKTINAAAYYKYRTLEVRMHEGSVDYNEISKWVDLLVQIANYSKRMKDNVIKLPTLKKRLKLKKKLYNYAIERSCSWQIQNNDFTRAMRHDIEDMQNVARTHRLEFTVPTTDGHIVPIATRITPDTAALRDDGQPIMLDWVNVPAVATTEAEEALDNDDNMEDDE